MARETRWKLTCSRLAEAQRPICRGAIKGFSFSDHPGPTLPQLTRLLLANPGERPLSGCWPFWLLAFLVAGLSGYWPVWLLACLVTSHVPQSRQQSSSWFCYSTKKLSAGLGARIFANRSGTPSRLGAPARPVDHVYPELSPASVSPWLPCPPVPPP